MEISFKNSDVEKLCINLEYAKKKIPLEAAEGLRILMVKLIAADNLAFFVAPENLKYNLEKLRGKQQYELSLRVKPGSKCGYRMILECLNTDIKDNYKNMYRIRILDINNHEYK